ncbi:VOC family protein [Parasedimentitalea marina]|uniref:VOC family protein n=1 Tax=Parasedimentitalea marina TaxID=2483033 RepID=A0A3T0N385_9RHOB|nr:VOC family protein [Parasedimentitalea marina]AZV78459.1 VOC family protein [Parasedimentitalea marina]
MTYSPKDFLVWGELPVTDLAKACEFYGTVTGAHLSIDDSGPNPIAMFKPADQKTGVALHLYPGKPAIDGSGPTLHLAAQGTLEEVMVRVTKAGGEVTSDAIEIPPGKFFYAKDPDGNSIGFFFGHDH